MTEGQKEYQNYLTSDWWESVKIGIHKKQPKCQICKKPFNLEIHHLDYSNRGKTREWLDVRRVCRHHHRACHRILWIFKLPLKKKYLLPRYYFVKSAVFTGYSLRFLFFWLYDNFYINSGNKKRRPRRFFSYK